MKEEDEAVSQKNFQFYCFQNLAFHGDHIERFSYAELVLFTGDKINTCCLFDEIVKPLTTSSGAS